MELKSEMSIYCLLEGKETERKIYPRWFEHIMPHYKPVNKVEEAKENNYYIDSAHGQPLWNELARAIKTINEFPQYKYLLLCMDSERLSVEEVIAEAKNELQRRNTKTCFAKLVYIIQNRCFETWLLGNREIVKPHLKREAFQKYIEFYDVSKADPELMGKPDWCKIRNQNAVTRFHHEYLKAIMPKYSKSSPNEVQSKEFLIELINRIQDKPEHLQSFQRLVNFCNSLQN